MTSYGDWVPFVLPAQAPVAMRNPRELSLPYVWECDGDAAHFLASGLGFVHGDIRWMWRWDSSGWLHLWRAWTGLEIFRVLLEPAERVPGAAAWRIVKAEREADSLAELDAPGDAGTELLVTLDGILALRDFLGNLPGTRQDVIAASQQPGAPWPAPIGMLSQALQADLPLHVHGLRMHDRDVLTPPDLSLSSATQDGEAVALTFSDGGRLWLHQPWRAMLDADVVATDQGGALLWPGPTWPIRLAGVASWGVLRRADGSVAEVARDHGGDAVPRDILGPQLTGLSDLIVQLQTQPARRRTRTAGNERSRAIASGVPDAHAIGSAHVEANGAEAASQLALRIARCQEIRLAGDASHPCHRIVTLQGDPSNPARRLPEPWAGGIETARVLYISSNPSINVDDLEGPQSEESAQMDWSEERIGNYLMHRFSADSEPVWSVDDRYLRQDGTHSAKRVPYWREARKRSTELLGYAADPSSDYALTEVVRCKSQDEIGVAAAAPRCIGNYLDETLRICPAPLVVIVGSKSRDRSRGPFELPPGFGMNYTAAADSVHVRTAGGRPRVVLYLPHFTGMEPNRTFAERFNGGEVEVLRSVALGRLAVEHFTSRWADVTGAETEADPVQ